MRSAVRRRTPDDQRARRRTAALRAPAGCHRHDVPGAPRGEDAAAGRDPLTQLVDLPAQPVELVAQPVVVHLELEDPLDPGEVDPLVLAEPLYLTQQCHVPRGVASAA